MKYKSRVKHIENGEDLMNGTTNQVNVDEKKIIVKRKNGENDRHTTNKKFKKENKKGKLDETKKEPIRRSDSPGIDLSIFQPRGKRKCVIQNELKKQRTDDWWSDEEEEEEEEIDDEPPKVFEEEDDEIEEEIPDVDDEQEVEIKDDDDEVEEEIEDVDDDDHKVVQREKVVNPAKNKRCNNKKKNPSKQPILNLGNGVAVEKTVVEKTVRCFVFSTAMANRAGHAVSKGLFNTISTYHEAQKWDTPYLSSEIHCRPFIAALEEEIEKREQEEITVVKKEPEVNGDSIVVKPSDVKEESKERTLSVDSWQKEQVIQAAQRMGRVGQNKDMKLSDDAKVNPLHPRFNLLGGSQPPHNSTNNIINGRDFNEMKTDSSVQKNLTTDSESLPQTVPKIEKSENDSESQISPNSIKTLTINNSLSRKPLTTPPSEEGFNRRLSPPPQLVPTIQRHKAPPEVVSKQDNVKSYSIGISHMKDIMRYHSPKEFALHKLLTKPPSVSISQDVHDVQSKIVRSSIDENARLETSRMKRSPPILPRDIHPSAFISPRDRDHLRQSAFNGYTSGSLTPNGNSLFNPHLRPSSFSPPTSRHYQHSREAIENMVDFSRNSVIIPPPPVRPSVSRPNGFPESKTFEDYKPLSSSSISSIHQRKDRPSSLPVAEVFAGKEKKQPPMHSSFSVDSLTQSLTRNERTADENSVARHIERRFPISSHPRSFHERLPIPHDLHAHDLHAHDRLHIPNGANFHNGLKRTLDEQLSSNILREQAERDHRKYYDHLREEWLWKDKERRMLELERLLPSRPPFPTDPRSPLHMPPVYLTPRGIPLNGQLGELPSPPHRPHRIYSPYGRR